MSDNWQLKAVLSANAQGMIKALGDVGKMAKNTRKYLADIAGAAGDLGQRIALPSGLIGTLLAGFSGAAVKNAMVGLAELEDEVSKFSATTGIAGAEYKRFQYLAQLSNVPFEVLTGNMAKLNKGIYDAANGGNKNLAALFDRLGIKARDSSGELRSAASLLPELADAFQRNENPAVRSAMGMALFGKSWREIMPMLAEGSAKINERMARFKELGLEVKDVEAFDRQMEAAGKFGDKLDDLGFVAKGFQNTIAAGLLPVITPLIDGLIKWIVANKDLVAGEVKQFVTDLAASLRTVDWRGVIEGAKSFARGLGSVVEWLGGTRNALIALVLFMNAQTIMALAGMAGAVLRLGAYLFGVFVPATKAADVATVSWYSKLKAMPPLLGRIAVAPLAALGVFGLLAGAAWLIYDNWEAVSTMMGVVFEPLAGSVQELASSAGALFGELYATVSELAGLLAPIILPVLKAIGFVIGGAIIGGLRLAVLATTGLVKGLTLVLDVIKSVAGFFGDIIRSVKGWLGMDSATMQQVAGTAPGPVGTQPLGQAPLLDSKRQEVGGKFSFEFANAPPGLRLANQSTKGNTDIDLSMGHRGFATGMP